MAVVPGEQPRRQRSLDARRAAAARCFRWMLGRGIRRDPRMPETLASPQSRQKELAVEKRRGGLRAIGAEVPRIAGAALGKRGFGEAQLVDAMAGDHRRELAEKLRPSSSPSRAASGATARCACASLRPCDRAAASGAGADRAHQRLLRLSRGRPARPRPGPAAAATARATAACRKLERPRNSAPSSRELAGDRGPDLRAALAQLGSAVTGSRRD